MSERCERTSKRGSKWLSSLRVDFIVILPNVRLDGEQDINLQHFLPVPMAMKEAQGNGGLGWEWLVDICFMSLVDQESNLLQK